ncbi:MAG: ribonuclease J [Bacillota bacterium]
MSPAKKNKLRIVPLGGMGEIGKNMTVFEYGDDIFVLDCGSMFPSESMLGIDLVIPDISYLILNKDRIRAFVISHGHEDHIGALPYILKEVQAPIYGTRITLALIENKLNEHGVKADLRCVSAGDTLHFGCFVIELIKTTHSIAGALALAIHTPVGIVVHTGDFKIDFTPIDTEGVNLAKFAQLGEQGVLCLMSDSTNVERPGYTMSERSVGEAFERYFKKAKGRIIVATFASNIHRVQQVIDTALRFGRKVCFQGRSMINIASMALELGDMTIDESMMIDVEQTDNIPPDQVVIITTGSQGEPMSGLVRMATSGHRIDIEPDDMIIISATPIPGNEKFVSNVVNQLYRKGATVIYESLADVHVSGHACQEELKIILSLTKPRYFIPVHGEYRHLYRHGELAESMGVPKENVFVLDIGNVIELDESEADRGASVAAGSVMVDGLGIGDVGNIVLRDRRILSQDGLFVVVLAMSRQDNALVGVPDIISRGFVYVRESEDLIEDAKSVICDTINDMELEHADWNAIKNSVRAALRDYLYNKTKRNPMILPIIVEV